MTHTIIVNDKEFQAYDWYEAPLPKPGEPAELPHSRNSDVLEKGVSELSSGEASFLCDQTFVFDTLLSLKGDGRKFVVLSGDGGRHVAKPY